ncbi:hypothetical protein ACJJTC_002727 [Scirpophaga incertulas]
MSRSTIPSKKSKIDLLEEKVEGMFAELLQRLEKRKESSRSFPINNEYPQHRYCRSDDDMDPIYSFSRVSTHRSLSAESWCAPKPEDLSKAGIRSWNKIKYKEVEKCLKAAPVFGGLKVNPPLERYAQKSFISSILLRLDDVLATITQGLLRKRKALGDEIKKYKTFIISSPKAFLWSKDKDLDEEMKKTLSNSSSLFKSLSDDLLHLACARRAEVLDLRRKFFKAGTDFLSGKLQEIPPSEIFLFDEQRLSDFIKEEGGYHRVFLSRSGKTYRSLGQPIRKSARKRPSEVFAAPRATKSSEPKWRSRPSTSTSTGQSAMNLK